MLLSLMDDPQRIAVQGKVVWITPDGVQGNRTQGIGVQFTQRRDRCLGARANRADSRRDTGVEPTDAHDVTLVRRLPLSPRFPRAPGRLAGGARGDGREPGHARPVHQRQPAGHALRRASWLPNMRRSTPRWACIPTQENTPDPAPDELVRLAAQPKVVAIGETGLDYYRLKGDLSWQRARFRNHIRAARTCRKPLVIHTRAAAEDTLAIMREEGAGEAGGVMHCFTESWEVAAAALELGFYISFSGIVTFKNAQALKDVARRVPLERMLIETDAPYLAPVPFRGKTNQPAYVRYVAEEIARLRGIDRRRGRRGDVGQFLSPVWGEAEWTLKGRGAQLRVRAGSGWCSSSLAPPAARAETLVRHLRAGGRDRSQRPGARPARARHRSEHGRSQRRPGAARRRARGLAADRSRRCSTPARRSTRAIDSATARSWWPRWAATSTIVQDAADPRRGARCARLDAAHLRGDQRPDRGGALPARLGRQGQRGLTQRHDRADDGGARRPRGNRRLACSPAVPTSTSATTTVRTRPGLGGARGFDGIVRALRAHGATKADRVRTGRRSGQSNFRYKSITK